MKDASPDYFRAVEQRFTSLRGGVPFLTPGDWDVATGWQERGIPLDIVLAAIGGVFARLPRRAPRMPLARCAPAVEAAFRNHRRRGAGAASGATESPGSGPGPEPPGPLQGP